jgi:hypothetical protein
MKQGCPAPGPAVEERRAIVGHAVRESDECPTVQEPRRVRVSTWIATAERKDSRELRPRKHVEYGRAADDGRNLGLQSVGIDGA